MADSLDWSLAGFYGQGQVTTECCIRWRGEWDPLTTYNLQDAVSMFNPIDNSTSSYISTSSENLGNYPSESSEWDLLCGCATEPQGPQSGLGIGQTWQNGRFSREFGTTYTNSTGQPISVSVSTASSNAEGDYFEVTVGGVSIINDVSTAGVAGAVTFIVPAGSIYSVGSAKTLNRWVELR